MVLLVLLSATVTTTCGREKLCMKSLFVFSEKRQRQIKSPVCSVKMTAGLNLHKISTFNLSFM